MSDAWLVVGLGNPGPGYAGHRHNVGFQVLDVLAQRLGGRFKGHKGRADVVEARLGAHRVVLAKPRSYMNESGGPVSAVRDFFGVELGQIVVVHDELDLDFGVLRIKSGGGDNGHNGLRSLTRSLGGPDYLRVRVGIGRPPGRMDPADFVLRDFSAAERRDLGVVVERAADATEALIEDGLERAQNTYNALP
ncbi:MAG TPA: aminoacyl-tRNA hydrolase [Candidatus Limnocylindria bacterium]|nr:aminoacyl-tRNA hydrolase [Candidatus Limnocylindria bacterium]